MHNAQVPKKCNLWTLFPWLTPEEKAIDTLTAFVHDAEHELLSVITALQGHVDLLHAEQALNGVDADRVATIDRTISRLITDTNVLASVADLAKAPRSNQKQLVETLMQEIAAETRTAFSTKQVSLSCDIASGLTLVGRAGALKLMITGMLLAVLHRCRKLESVRIVGVTTKRLLSLSFDTGEDAGEGEFKPWQLGELRLMPLNGDAIGLAAVDAMARLHRGHLSVSNLADHRHGYRLVFNV